MTKKEINEIKKLYKKDGDYITRICGCYVGNEKEIITTFQKAFYSLEEQETYKYYEIFKKTLSGNLGRNLLNLEFPLEQENEGGTQEFLLQLRDSGLQKEELLQEFYKKVIDSFECTEHYLILLIHNAYDIPGKTKDGIGMEDASDEVYSYLLCSVCPVNLSKAGLSYSPESNLFENSSQNRLVDLPQVGFLFPAFSQRSTDIHSVLYYTKNPDEIQEAFVDFILGAHPPIPAKSQKEMFHTLIQETLGENRDYETILNIQENIQERIEEFKEEQEPLLLYKEDVEKIFTESGIQQEKMEQFSEIYEKVIPKASSLVAENVVNTRKVEVKTPNIKVQVKPEFTHLLETKEIDGRNCLVIAIEDQVEVNGILL